MFKYNLDELRFRIFVSTVSLKPPLYTPSLHETELIFISFIQGNSSYKMVC
jgi:hypothetical protein